MTYRAPVDDLTFTLEHLSGFDRFRNVSAHDAADPATMSAILSEAGSVAEGILVPLQRSGDISPARLQDGEVRTSPGFADAYRTLAEGGWVGMIADPAWGGMGLPASLSVAVHEIFSGACLSLQLNPLLTQGQIVALQAHASSEICARYLPNLASGKWAGTMNLTEPQAGSDVGAVRSRAEEDTDGTYRVSGQKIYISWGDSDLTENVIHLVLARLPDAPPGTRGLSLFLVPKFIPDDEGEPGERNGVRTVSLEHKLGLHGSPTAVLEFDGATGWIVGERGGGMAAMFSMMNEARLCVGAQGVGVAEAACQKAAAFAAERVQGKSEPTGAIIDHADIRRSLAWMRARIVAARAIVLCCATAIDMERATGDAFWAARAALLIPIAKSFGTETGISVADRGIQIHGGMGYIEETGAAQFFRDARVTAIYEGTNGIQAMDLVGRKLRDGGEAASALLDEIEAGAESARTRAPDLAGPVWEAAETLRDATDWMAQTDNPSDRFAGGTPYLEAFALVLGAHFHLHRALVEGPDAESRRLLARLFIQRQLPLHLPLLTEATLGAGDLSALDPEMLHA